MRDKHHSLPQGLQEQWYHHRLVDPQGLQDLGHLILLVQDSCAKGVSQEPGLWVKTPIHSLQELQIWKAHLTLGEG